VVGDRSGRGDNGMARRSRIAVIVILVMALAVALATAHALSGDGASGPVIRALAAPDGGVPLAVDARTGRVFAVFSRSLDPTGYAWMLDADTGARLRTVPLGAQPGPIGIDPRTGSVYVGNRSDVTIDVLDGRRGTVLCTISLPDSANPTGLIMDGQGGRLFVTTTLGVVYTLNPADGRVRGVARVDARDAPTNALAGDERTGRIFVADFNNGSSTAPGTLSMLDARTGRRLRTVAVGLFPQVVAVDERANRVVVLNAGNGAPTMTILDARTGRALHTVPILFRGMGQPLLALDARFTHIFDGETVRDTRTGAPLYRLNAVGGVVEQPIAVTADTRRGRVYIADFDMTPCGSGLLETTVVHVVDARSGALLRSVAIGSAPTSYSMPPAPVSMAVDPRSGHLFVSTPGGLECAADAWSWQPDWLRRWLPFVPAPSFRTRDGPPHIVALDLSR